MTTNSRHVEVTYCDDIRQETGNKVSLMGVYSTDLNVTAPVMLARLCIAVKVVTDISDPFTSVSIRVLQGEDHVEIASAGPIAIPEKPSVDLVKNHYMALHFAIVLSPFQIEKDTILRVRALTEREELKGPALRIHIVPDPNQAVKH